MRRKSKMISGLLTGGAAALLLCAGMTAYGEETQTMAEPAVTVQTTETAAMEAEIGTDGQIYGESTGWVSDENGVKYYSEDLDGYYQDGFYSIGDDTYYFDEEGYLTAGWQEINGETYYFGDDGIMRTGLQEIEGNVYLFLAEDGIMYTGWFYDADDATYYFDESGAMVKGWQQIQEQWYHFSDDGIMDTQWQTIGGCKYYFGDMYDGAMRTDWQEIDGEKYYFGDDGEMRTMWQTIGGNRYYFGKTGVMRTMFETIGGKKYYFGKTGVMRIQWETIGGNKYYFGNTGAMQTMWQTIGGKRYYFGKSGIMRTMYEYIGNKVYYFGKTGVMRTGWETIGGKKHYFGTNGVMYTGLRKIGNYKYYFNEYTGDMMKSETFSIYSDGSGGNGCYVTYALEARADKYGHVTTFGDSLSKARHASGSSFQVVNISDPSENIGWSSYTSYVSNADKAILKKFANEHFKKGMTWEQKLKITMEWIHYNVDYAYAGEAYLKIANKTCADAVFTYQAGQCLQYNGALAEMLTWMGFDVEMRFLREGNWQHFWTVLKMNGKQYHLECGNHGKNGEWFYITRET